jgi:hypothetical protein
MAEEVVQRAPRAVERRRWLSMEAGPDGGCAWRWYRGWSTTKRGGGGRGSSTAGTCVYCFYFSCKKEEMVND